MGRSKTWRAGHDINNNRIGITLVEVIVYLALVSMVCVLVLTRIVQMVPAYQDLCTRSQLQSVCLRLHDVICADYHRAREVYCFDDCMICSNDNGAYGWELHSGTLCRIVGTYDVHAYQWLTKRSIAMAHDVAKCCFKRQDDLLHVVLVLERRGQRYELSWDVVRRVGAVW
ncbi:type II secretion system protein [Candidatus Babeliales bacterium]|nr:type II secretion system protein [Candidatus Babeliales bacterium]